MRKRAASSILIGAMFLVGSPVWPDALSSAVTDPAGDLSSPCGDFNCQPYQDIVQAEIAKRGGMFVLGMTVAEAIPSSPTLQAGVKQISWIWALETNAQTFPAGFPYAPGIANPFEFIVQVVWDGTLFTGHVIDRRPLLAGGEAVVTPVPFKIKGADITMVVDESLIDDPSSFVWAGFAGVYLAGLETGSGTDGLYGADGTAFVIWPS